MQTHPTSKRNALGATSPSRCFMGCLQGMFSCQRVRPVLRTGEGHGSGGARKNCQVEANFIKCSQWHGLRVGGYTAADSVTESKRRCPVHISGQAQAVYKPRWTQSWRIVVLTTDKIAAPVDSRSSGCVCQTFTHVSCIAGH